MTTTPVGQPSPPGAASYGQSLLVALGWYATVVAALAVGMLSVPERPPRPEDCVGVFSCMSPAEGLLLATIFGLPFFAGLLLVTALVTRPVARRVPSPIVAGTLCAAASVAVVAAVVAVYAGSR